MSMTTMSTTTTPTMIDDETVTARDTVLKGVDEESELVVGRLTARAPDHRRVRPSVHPFVPSAAVLKAYESLLATSATSLSSQLRGDRLEPANLAAVRYWLVPGSWFSVISAFWEPDSPGYSGASFPLVLIPAPLSPSIPNPHPATTSSTVLSVLRSWISQAASTGSISADCIRTPTRCQTD